MNRLIFPFGFVIVLMTASCKKTSVEARLQTPANLNFTKAWGKAYGGNNRESSYAIVGTTDGGYVLLGRTESNDRDVVGFQGFIDIWALKVDAAGNKVWQRSIGGSQDDYGSSVVQAPDGGFTGVGFTKSMDGDVLANNGGSDAMLFKLDGNGNLLWTKTFGTAGDDFATSIISDGSGNYLIAGFSNVGSSSASDAQSWVFKVDGNGSLLWEKKYGGSGIDQFTTITSNANGGFLLSGVTGSNDGDVSGHKGGVSDAWVMKIDNNGNKLWQKTVGGTANESATGHVSTVDGGCIVVGRAGSTDGDFIGHHGNLDGFAIKLDNSGNKVWCKMIGGSANDWAHTIIASKDGGYLIGANSRSGDGDFTTTLGLDDGWIIKINAAGNYLGKQIVGGTNIDQIGALAAGNDGSYALAGLSNSLNGDVSGYQGNVVSDAWILKFQDQ